MLDFPAPVPDNRDMSKDVNLSEALADAYASIGEAQCAEYVRTHTPRIRPTEADDVDWEGVWEQRMYATRGYLPKR